MNNTNEVIGKKLVGRVKWFNSKTGYGFLTVVSGGDGVEDVFVHHSAISVVGDQYKYLVQGEYVDFDVTTVDEGAHKHQAKNVTGVGGGQTMCETRNDIRKERENDGDGDGGGRHTRNHTSNRRHNQSNNNGDSEVSGLVRRELWNLLNDDNNHGNSSSRRRTDNTSRRRMDNTSE